MGSNYVGSKIGNISARYLVFKQVSFKLIT